MISQDKQRLGYVGGVPGATRDGNAWYTPEKYLKAVRKVFGQCIDLDPYSSPEANERVKALRYFTAEDPAPMGEAWPKVTTCFMNPPYSGVLVRQAVGNFLAALRAERFHEGIVLVNAATETRWFQALLRDATYVCFPAGRIRFDAGGNQRTSSNTSGQAFLFFERWPAGHIALGECAALRFLRTFQEFGPVLLCRGGVRKVNG